MGKQSTKLLCFCQRYRCSRSNPGEWPRFVTSLDSPCRAHRYLLPNNTIFWIWFAFLGRVFVCGCPRGSRCLFRFFFPHLLSTGKKRASNDDLHTESRQSLSCSLRDMGVPTSLAQDVLPVAQKIAQKPVHSRLNILGPQNVWGLAAKILRRLSSFDECHQYMRLVGCIGFDAMTTGIPKGAVEGHAAGQDSYLHPFDRSDKPLITSRGMWVLLPPTDRRFPESDSTEWTQAAG